MREAYKNNDFGPTFELEKLHWQYIVKSADGGVYAINLPSFMILEKADSQGAN